MNINILKKISEKIKFTENKVNNKIEYVVERKNSKTHKWETLSRSIRIERALVKKHNAWYGELHRLNYTMKLLNRRKKRSRK